MYTIKLFCNMDSKIYVGVTNDTNRVLDSDFFSFNKRFKTMSEFLNNIITYYGLENPYNPTYYINKKLNELEVMFKDKRLANKLSKNDLLNLAMISWNSFYDKEIAPMLDEKGDHKSFRIIKANQELLNLDYKENNTTSNLDAFNKAIRNYDCNAGKYLKALFYSYSLLPYYKREAIAYGEIVSKIKNIINENKVAEDGKRCITVDMEGSRFICKPVKIFCDKQVNHTYLLCLSKHADIEGESFSPKAIRITNIKSIKKRLDRPSGKITENEYKQLHEQIESKGSIFLMGHIEKVTVKLTDKGLNRFYNETVQRPTPIKISYENDNNILYFSCTAFQITAYFYKFGKEFEILEPAFLRKKVFNFYKTAYENLIE